MSAIADKATAGPALSSAMNTVVLPNEETFSIADSSQILGLEPFSVYSLIQHRKLNADRTLLGELFISRNELVRVLGDHAEFPKTGKRAEA